MARGTIKSEQQKVYLSEAISFFCLTPSDNFVAKKIWEVEDNFSIDTWELKFNEKGLKLNNK